MKPAYMIIAIDIHDEAGMQPYVDGATPLLAEFGAEIVAMSDDPEVLDGTWKRGRTIILKFPSREKAKAFWESPEYLPLKVLREKFSDQDNILLEGL